MSGLVCAHRGASIELADNSLEAFAAAVASGCDAVETDIRRAPDGRLVCAHDPWDAERPDVTELAALLELAHGRIGLDLEIVEAGLERELLDVVEGFDGWLVVTSVYPHVLRDVAAHTRHIGRGLVVETAAAGGPFAGDPFGHADACGADIVLVEHDLATPELTAQAQGRPLWAWTVNDRAALAALLADPAIAGVITDDPVLACAVRAELDATAAGSLSK